MALQKKQILLSVLIMSLLILGEAISLVYPRYVQAGTSKWEKLDLDAVCDHILAGESDTGFYAYPHSFIARNIGGVFDAVDTDGTRVYGGAGDEGSVDGADANAVLQACIDALDSVGGELYIKKGVYPDIALTMNNNDNTVTIAGDGIKNTQLIGTAGSPVIDVDDTSRIILKGLTLDGDSNATYGILGKIYASTLLNVQIENCTETALAMTGNLTVELGQGNSNLLMNVWLGNSKNGLTLDYYSYDNQFYNVQCYGNTENGLKLYSSNNKFRDCYFFNNDYNGVYINGYTAWHSQFDGCDATSNGKHGFHLEVPKGIMIRNCHIGDNSQSAAGTYQNIYLEGSADWYITHVLIEGNYFYGTDPAWHIKSNGYTTHIIITENDFQESAASGFIYGITDGLYGCKIPDDNMNYRVRWSNSGEASIVDPATSVTFAHGLGAAPTSVQICPKSGVTYTSHLPYVSADATNITITIDTAQTRDFYWYAERKIATY
jgi:hypothetical protein